MIILTDASHPLVVDSKEVKEFFNPEEFVLGQGVEVLLDPWCILHVHVMLDFLKIRALVEAEHFFDHLLRLGPGKSFVFLFS